MMPDKTIPDAFARENSERRWMDMILSSANIEALCQNIRMALTEAGDERYANDIVRYIKELYQFIISRAEPTGIPGRIVKSFSEAAAAFKSDRPQTQLKDVRKLLGNEYKFGILKKAVDLCATAAPGVDALIYLAEQTQKAGMIKENELQNIKEYCRQSRTLFGDKRTSTPIDAFRRATTPFRSRLGVHERIIPLSEWDIPEPFLTRLMGFLHKE